jgi:hypothetical protein
MENIQRITSFACPRNISQMQGFIPSVRSAFTPVIPRRLRLAQQGTVIAQLVIPRDEIESQSPCHSPEFSQIEEDFQSQQQPVEEPKVFDTERLSPWKEFCVEMLKKFPNCIGCLCYSHSQYDHIEPGGCFYEYQQVQQEVASRPVEESCKEDEKSDSDEAADKVVCPGCRDGWNDEDSHRVPGGCMEHLPVEEEEEDEEEVSCPGCRVGWREEYAHRGPGGCMEHLPITEDEVYAVVEDEEHCSGCMYGWPEDSAHTGPGGCMR